MDKRHSLTFDLALWNGAALALARSYHVGLRIVFIYLLVEQIGVQAYGFYAYAQSWYVLLLPLAAWGGNELLISGLISRSDDEQHRFAGTALTLRLALGAASGLLIVVIALAAETRHDLALLMLVFSQAVFVRGLIGLVTSLFTARGRSIEWIRLSVFFMTLEVVLVLWFAGTGAALYELALLQTLVWWATLLTGARFYAARYAPVHPRWDTGLAGWFLREGALVGLASFLILALTPGLLLAYRYLAPQLGDLGPVALVLQVFLILQQFLTLVTNALLPALERPSGNRSGNLAGFSATALSLALCAAGALSMALRVVIPRVLASLDPTPFDGALLLLAEHAWILVPVLVMQVFQPVLIASGRGIGFLTAVASGYALALAYMVLVSAAGTLVPAAVFHAMGMGMGVVAAIELLWCWRAGAFDPRDRTGLPVAAALLAANGAAWVAAETVSPLLAAILVPLFAVLGWRQLQLLRAL
ncbi:MAG: MATE family efflux transporter [Pseudohaliea sp.]